MVKIVILASKKSAGMRGAWLASMGKFGRSRSVRVANKDVCFPPASGGAMELWCLNKAVPVPRSPDIAKQSMRSQALLDSG